MSMAYKRGEIVGYVDLSETNDVSVPREPVEWLLVRVQPMRERHVEERLHANGISCYLPSYEKHVSVGKWRHWTISRKRKVRTPIFPGMIFVPQFDARLWMLQGICSFVGGFVRTREDAILGADRNDPYAGFARMSHRLFLQMQVLERNYDRPQSKKGGNFKAGDQVRIRQGNPFALWSGRIERLDDKGRLKVLISIMQREVTVSGLTVDQVEAV